MLSTNHLAVEDIRLKIGQLPDKLKDQHDSIFGEIMCSRPATASIAQKTFSWLLAAQRPLTCNEHIAAVALDDDGYYHADLDCPRLLDICRSLIIESSYDTASHMKCFKFAHLSVKEYFEEHPTFTRQTIHLTVVLRCLAISILAFGAPKAPSMRKFAFMPSFWITLHSCLCMQNIQTS